MKLLVTESQLEVIIAHIAESRKPKEEVLEEGWKEVVLGAAMLMGIGLTGVNAQTAKNALNNQDILNKIEKTLEGPQIDKLAQTLEDGGLENAMDKIQANADQIETNFEYAAKKKGLTTSVQIYNTKSTKKAGEKIKQGYAVEDIEVTQDTVWTSSQEIELGNTLEVVFDANVFKTGTYDLEDSVTNELKNTIESILMMGGTINSIRIESSTDTEPIKIGNEKLAQLRANSVEGFISGMVKVPIKIKTLPEQGPDVFSTNMTSQERDSVRKETAKYRYVKVIIDSEVKPQPKQDVKAFKVITSVKYTLVKANNLSTKNTTSDGFKSTTKTFTLKSITVDGVVNKCEAFGVH